MADDNLVEPANSSSITQDIDFVHTSLLPCHRMELYKGMLWQPSYALLLWYDLFLFWATRAANKCFACSHLAVMQIL